MQVIKSDFGKLNFILFRSSFVCGSDTGSRMTRGRFFILSRRRAEKLMENYDRCDGKCFIMFGCSVMVLANLLCRENRIFDSLGLSSQFLLQLSLVGTKLKQKPLSPFTTNVCGVPTGRQGTGNR